MSESGTNPPADQPEGPPGSPPSPPPGGGWPPPPSSPSPSQPQGPPFGPPPHPGPPPGYPQGPQPGYQQGPPPGYQLGPPPGYQGPGYQQAPGYQQGPPTGYAPGASHIRPQPAEAPPRPARPNLLETAPALGGSLAISLGVIVLWLAALVVSLGGKGLAGKDRLLQFLSPGNVTVAVALLLAVLLVVIHQQSPAESAGGRSQAQTALLVAMVLAGAAGLASLLRGITELTIAHQRGAIKLGRFIDGLAALPISAAAIVWALRARTEAGGVVTPSTAAVSRPDDPAPTASDLSAGGFRPPPAPPSATDPTVPVYNPPPGSAPPPPLP